MLQVKKLKEHVYVKILNMNQSMNQANDTNNNTNTASTNQQAKQASNSLGEMNANQILDLANKTIELICSEQVR